MRQREFVKSVYSFKANRIKILTALTGSNCICRISPPGPQSTAGKIRKKPK
jgi:hypothetical protein